MADNTLNVVALFKDGKFSSNLNVATKDFKEVDKLFQTVGKSMSEVGKGISITLDSVGESAQKIGQEMANTLSTQWNKVVELGNVAKNLFAGKKETNSSEGTENQAALDSAAAVEQAKQDFALKTSAVLADETSVQQQLATNTATVVGEHWSLTTGLFNASIGAVSESWDSLTGDLQKQTLGVFESVDGIFTAIRTNSVDNFFSMFEQIGAGWDGLKELIRGFGDKMVASIVESLQKVVMAWISQTAILQTIEQGWAALKIALGVEVATAETTTRGETLATNLAADTAEISSAASVGAAKAAAATAWSLWGAIAIGAAIGMAIMAFAGSFARGGIVGGNSYAGDNMLARVNSGEMILNSAQQARLFDMANGGEGVGMSGGAIINQNISVGSGADLAAITQAIKRGTSQALELANVAYKAGKKQNKYVG